MDLKEEIRKLVELQRIDSKIQSLREKKDKDIPQELEALKKAFEEAKQIISSHENKVKQLQVKRKEKELDLSSKEEGVKKAQAQLYQLKTNKEYQAKLTEIESLKADVSLLEEEVIKILDQIEEAQDNLNKEKHKLIQEENKFKEKESQINEEIKSLGLEIKCLEDKRKILADNIDKKVLSVYERLLKNRSGLAVAGIEADNCGACHIKVTAQKINEIKMYKDLVFCESCVRILYIKDDIE
jgi:hypothetical protein